MFCVLYQSWLNSCLCYEINRKLKINPIWSRFTKVRNQIRTIIEIFRKTSVLRKEHSLEYTQNEYIYLNLINAVKDVWNKIEEISKQSTKSKYTT